MKNGGFTIIETLFVLIILTLLVGIVFVSFRKLNDSQVLDGSTLLVASIIDDARSLTISAQDASQYGVHLESGQMTRFAGATYSSSPSTYLITTLDSRIGIRSVSLDGGGSDVIFKKLTAQTDNQGTFEVYLKASTTIYKTVTIRATGIVEISQ